MSNKKNNFSAKGYYIALVLCAAAIGVSAYLYYRGGNEEADVPAAVIQQEDPMSAAAAKPGVEREETVTPPQTAATEPEKPLKTAAPVDGTMVAEFAMECLSYNQTTRDWRVHDGVDFAAEAGTKVCAAADGTVYTVYEDETMGMTVVINHEGGYTTKYASLAEEVSVAPGDTVELGQTIGCVGNSALLESALGDHLHFAVTCNGESVDPAVFLETE